MAIAFVGAADLGDNGGTTNSLTVSYTVGATSNRLFIAVTGDQVSGGFNDITGVTYAGVSASLVTSVTSGLGERMTYLYTLASPATGANNVIVTSTNNHYLLVGAADYSGVSTGALDAQIGSTDSVLEDTYTSSITTVADNCWVLTVAENGAFSVSGGTGATLRAHGATYTDWGLFDSNGVVHPAGSFSAATTLNHSSTSQQIHVMASFGPPLSSALLTIDRGISNEWAAALTIDRGISNEWIPTTSTTNNRLSCEFLSKVIESGSLSDFSSDFSPDFTGSVGGVGMPLDFTVSNRIGVNIGSEFLLPVANNNSLLTELSGVVSIIQNGTVPLEIISSLQSNVRLLEAFISSAFVGGIFQVEWPIAQPNNISVYGDWTLRQQRGDEVTLSEWFSYNRSDVSFQSDVSSNQYVITPLSVSLVAGQRQDLGLLSSAIASQRQDAILSVCAVSNQRQDILPPIDLNGAMVVTFNDLLPTEILEAIRAGAAITNELLLVQRQDSSIFTSLIALLRQDLALPVEFSSGLLNDWEVLDEWKGSVNIASNVNIPIELFSSSRIDIVNNNEVVISTERADYILRSEIIFTAINDVSSSIEITSSLVTDQRIIAEMMTALLNDGRFLPEFMITAFCNNGLTSELIIGSQKDTMISSEWLAQTFVADSWFSPIEWAVQIGVPLVGNSSLPIEWMAVPEFLLTSPSGLLIEWILLPVPGPGQVIKTGGDKVLIVSSDLLPKNG
jgi:hypothetical protein